MIFEIDVSNVYKRKSECRDIEYLVSYVRKDNRYYMHPLVHKEFYRKKDMIQHIKKAYKNKKVLSDLRIWKRQKTYPKAKNNMDKITMLNEIKNL